MQYGRHAGYTAEQRPRIQTDALDTTAMQQAIKAALLLAFGKERRMTHLDGQLLGLPRLEKSIQFRQALRTEACWQLEPERRHPLAQWRQQPAEILGGAQLLAQVPVMADITRQLGAKTQMRRHTLGPTRHGIDGGLCIEGGVALNGVEHLGIQR